MIDKVVDNCVRLRERQDKMRCWGGDVQTEHGRYAGFPSLTICHRLVPIWVPKVRVELIRKNDEANFVAGRVLDWDEPYKPRNADALVILTELNEFRALDLTRMAKRMATAGIGGLAQISYSPQKTPKRAGV